eukprot:tig00021350_g20639.t1
MRRQGHSGTMALCKRAALAAAFLLAVYVAERIRRGSPPQKSEKEAAFDGEVPASADEKHGEGAGLYSRKSTVLSITKKNLAVVLDGGFRLVEFYHPGCHHCKVFAPTYERAAEDLQGIADLAAIDCQAEYDLCNSVGISGYPAVKAVFHAGGAGEDSAKAVDALKAGTDFSGSRSVKALRDFALAHVPREHFPDLPAEEPPAAFAARAAPRAPFVYVPDAAGSAEADALVAALSVALRAGAAFALLRDPQSEAWGRLAAADRPHPALAALSPAGEALWYQGPFRIGPLSEWARARIKGA